MIVKLVRSLRTNLTIIIIRKRTHKIMQAVYTHITSSLQVNRLQKIKLLQMLQALNLLQKSFKVTICDLETKSSRKIFK